MLMCNAPAALHLPSFKLALCQPDLDWTSFNNVTASKRLIVIAIGPSCGRGGGESPFLGMVCCFLLEHSPQVCHIVVLEGSDFRP